MAQLGYGEGDEVTGSYEPQRPTGYITGPFYFRNSFVLTDPTVYKSLANDR